MPNDSSAIVQKLWNDCNVLRDDSVRLRDESLEDTENLPEPDELAQEITANLQSALEQFSRIYEELTGG